jgi:transcriptional regulator with XRE-family HTH domain
MAEETAFAQLRASAIALRRAGKSRREIAQSLGITSNWILNDTLRGEPPPPWTWRPNAKDGLRAKARDLRSQGLDYTRIAAELGVSKSSVSLWVRDLPRPERLSYEECRKRSAEALRSYWAVQRSIRAAEREAMRTAAAAQIGELSDREVLIAGAIAYWCEGAKRKLHRPADRVDFINSDSALIRFFLTFLDVAGVASERLIFRIYIHEDADADAAQRYWLAVTQAHPAQFRSPVLKRHNPRTVRKNTGDGYHGCLRIGVRNSSRLYRQIEAWAAAAMARADHPVQAGEPSDPQMTRQPPRPADRPAGLTGRCDLLRTALKPEADRRR